MIGAIIQARMGSSRLPGKVLKELHGKTVLERVVDRVALSELLDTVVVATSDAPIDDEIVKFCTERDINYFRGSEADVLSRYRCCAEAHDLSTIVRVTADCPLIDAEVIDHTIELFHDNKLDYASNTVPPETSRWPDGSDVEVFSIDALRLADEKATLEADREHVTFYFWKNTNGHRQNISYVIHR